LQKIFSEEDRPSELLPAGWNQIQTNYTLRYTLNKQVFILYGIVSDDTIIINLLDCKTLKTLGMVLKTKEVVKSQNGTTLDDYVNDSKKIIDNMTSEIVKPLLNQEAKDESSTNSNNQRNTDPLLVRPPRPGVPYAVDPVAGAVPYFPRNLDPIRDVGRADLNPFGGGGGMLFQPDFHPRHPFGPDM
jgi:proteasome inhibitor subunit 1 (PI31)